MFKGYNRYNNTENAKEKGEELCVVARKILYSSEDCCASREREIIRMRGQEKEGEGPSYVGFHT